MNNILQPIRLWPCCSIKVRSVDCHMWPPCPWRRSNNKDDGRVCLPVLPGTKYHIMSTPMRALYNQPVEPQFMPNLYDKKLYSRIAYLLATQSPGNHKSFQKVIRNPCGEPDTHKLRITCFDTIHHRHGGYSGRNAKWPNRHRLFPGCLRRNRP
jgi:hypothetical protein